MHAYMPSVASKENIVSETCPKCGAAWNNDVSYEFACGSGYAMNNGIRGAFYESADCLRCQLFSIQVELADWTAQVKSVMEEPCGDEKHCTCVPLLRRALAEAKAQGDEAREVCKALAEIFNAPEGVKNDVTPVVHAARKALGETT
jgi:hypothetical protein